MQLREKDLAARDLLALARALRAVTRRHAARMLINDGVDVVAACGASRLPFAGRCASGARPGSLDGRVRARYRQGQAAARAGADFVVFAPVYDTPTKRRFGPPVGLPALRAAVGAVPLPVVAIGGIDTEYGQARKNA